MALTPSIATFKQKILQCNFLDYNSVLDLSKFLNEPSMPLLVLGIHQDCIVRLRPTTRCLKAREPDEEGEDGRRVGMPASMVGINFNFNPNLPNFITQSCSKRFSTEERFQLTKEYSRQLRSVDSTNSDDAGYGAEEMANPMQNEHVRQLTIFMQLGKLYTTNGRKSWPGIDIQQEQFYDSNCVLVMDVSEGKAGSIWYVRNYWLEDENTGKRFHDPGTGFNGIPDGVGFVADHFNDLEFDSEDPRPMTIESLKPPCLEEPELVPVRLHPLDNNGKVELRRETTRKDRGGDQTVGSTSGSGSGSESGSGSGSGASAASESSSV